MNGDQQNQQNPAPTPAEGNPKQAVIEKLKSATSILVTVSSNPSIDQLASCIALTLLLEKYKKNATAVFSGKVPSALEFLKPNDRIQKTTDSLRDFIIAIDKSKADKLRYKVEDDVVKIFITPYKTSITEKDLQYNAGDFNVDLIVALGVLHQQDLDTAITAHGRIFHDAVVVSINNVAGGDFGVAHWEDFEASSLSELIAQFATELGPNSIDSDIATALLTGIVAETNRFSNEKTHPGTMGVSSVLLQAGADQQLVNQQLQSVMGGEVKLEAGTEIRPTMSAEEQEKQFVHQEDELVVGEDGSLDLSANIKPKATEEKPEDHAAEPVKEAEPEKDTKPEDKDEPEPVAPEPEDSPHLSETEPGGDLVISELEEKVAEEHTSVPEVPEAPEAPKAPEVHDPAEDPDDAEAARKAISDALKNAAADAEANDVPVEPAPAEQPDAPDAVPVISMPPTADTELPEMPMPQPAPGPGLPVAPQLPTFEPPATPQTDNVPPIGSEPAPLSMSPADQAFTMPLPPSGSFAQAPPIVMPPSGAAPGASAIPPPLPPPLPPAQ